MPKVRPTGQFWNEDRNVEGARQCAMGLLDGQQPGDFAFAINEQFFWLKP